MKILLDENLPKQLKVDFGIDYDVKTVRDMGWLGKNNGELLELIVFKDLTFSSQLTRIYAISETLTAVN